MKTISNSLSFAGAAVLCFAAFSASAQTPPPNGPLGGPEAYVIDARGQIVTPIDGHQTRTQIVIRRMQ